MPSFSVSAVKVKTPSGYLEKAIPLSKTYEPVENQLGTLSLLIPDEKVEATCPITVLVNSEMVLLDVQFHFKCSGFAKVVKDKYGHTELDFVKRNIEYTGLSIKPKVPYAVYKAVEAEKIKIKQFYLDIPTAPWWGIGKFVIERKEDNKNGIVPRQTVHRQDRSAYFREHIHCEP